MKSKLYSVVGMLLLTSFFVTPSLFIKINKIECESQYGPCNKEVNDKLNSAKGKRMYFTKIKLHQLLKNEFYIKEYQMHFKFPATYKENIIERKPVYAITNNTKAWFAQIDRDGYVVSITDISNLPFIITENEVPPVGGKVSQELTFSLEMLSLINGKYQVKSGMIKDNSLFFAIKPFAGVIFPLEGDKELSFAKLVFITGTAENAISDYTNNISLDLRFKNPVLRKM